MDSKFKIFVIAAIVVLAVSMAGSTFFVIKTIKSSAAAQPNNSSSSSTTEKPNWELTEIDLGEAIMTNIATEGNGQHFAKIKVKIGVESSKKVKKEFATVSEQITAKAANIRHELIEIIGEQSYSMLSDANKGKEKLADEIIVRLNTLLDTDLIKEVYFEEYFIQ